MRVAAIIPCYNEERGIENVIRSLFKVDNNIEIYVCDNGSTDRTRELARDAGAHVLREPRKGKGNAVRRLFRDVEADVYILIDGDDTYGTKCIKEGIHLINSGYDMVTGERTLGDIQQRAGHTFGNKLFTAGFRRVFGSTSKDVFSGLRIMSRRLVKTFPCISLEFELEAELEIFCARMRLPTVGIPVSIRKRKGSESKLNTLQDGAKITLLALRMLHREYPLKIYAPIAGINLVLAACLMTPVAITYLETGLVPRIPTLVTSCSLGMLSILLLTIGIILKEITNSRNEARYLFYLKK